jgi:hypothetical protein
VFLIQRASETVGRVHRDNIVSLEATERMLAVLTQSIAGPVERSVFRSHLDNAKANVTEPEEWKALSVIEANQGDALSGHQDNRARVVLAIEELGNANRKAIVRADQAARATGSAGAWALALATLISIGLTSLVAHQLGQQVLKPLSEVRAVLLAHRSGQRGRRCVKSGDPSWVTVLSTLDELLDRQRESTLAAGPDLRPLVAMLLDRQEAALELRDLSGRRIAASQRALEITSQSDGPPEVASVEWRFDATTEPPGAAQAEGLQESSEHQRFGLELVRLRDASSPASRGPRP